MDSDLQARSPFKMAVSNDSGATWSMHLPHIVGEVDDFTPQPITSAFRATDGTDDILFGMDRGGPHSGLWRSSDEGMTWRDTHGSTAGRHTTFIPLNDNKTILGLGGKKSDIDGWMPAVKSQDGGASYSQPFKLPFPALEGNQRPSVLRLRSGRLCFVADAQAHGTGAQPSAWATKHPLGNSSGVCTRRRAHATRPKS